MKSVSGCGTLSGRKINAFSTLNTIGLAPMASASVSTAVRVNPGAFRNFRRASRISAFMPPPLRIVVYFPRTPVACIGVRTGWGGGSVWCWPFLATVAGGGPFLALVHFGRGLVNKNVLVAIEFQLMTVHFA